MFRLKLTKPLLSQPENVMVDLTGDGDVLKIIDYGAARHSGEVDVMLSQNYETCHDFQYMSPESIHRVPVAAGTDIWGVGLLIYIMLVKLQQSLLPYLLCIDPPLQYIYIYIYIHM